MKHKIVTGLLFVMSCAVTAQITSGTITMAITDFSMPQMEEMGDMGGQMEEMMKSMTTSIHFKPGVQVTDINMFGMMNMKQYYQDDVMTQYMDMMGQKIKIVTPADDVSSLKSMGLDPEIMKDLITVKYDKSDTKTILGYKCYKAEVHMDWNDLITTDEDIPAEAIAVLENMNFVMYITEDIKMDQFRMQNMPTFDMTGTPLMWLMDMGMMKITMEAIEFDKDVNPAVFDAPEGDYKEMKIEDLQKMGMNPGSFGF